MGGPGYSAAARAIAVANGVVATTFVLSGGFAPGQPSDMPVPAALQGLIKDGTKTCSRQAPCVFFQTSTDEGKTWSKHHVALPAGGIASSVWVAADSGRPGRYAIGFAGQSGTSLNVAITDNSGETWSGPYTVPETGKGRDFKAWMDYGPTGVLGFMWKKVPDGAPTVAPPTSRAQTPEQVKAASMERPSPAFDVVWGDTRNQPKVTNGPTGIGGVQAYYGRVPFSVASKGAQCGRK